MTGTMHQWSLNKGKKCSKCGMTRKLNRWVYERGGVAIPEYVFRMKGKIVPGTPKCKVNNIA